MTLLVLLTGAPVQTPVDPPIPPPPPPVIIVAEGTGSAPATVTVRAQFLPGTTVYVFERRPGTIEPWARESPPTARFGKPVSRLLTAPVLATAVADSAGDVVLGLPAGRYWVAGDRDGEIHYIAFTAED